MMHDGLLFVHCYSSEQLHWPPSSPLAFWLQFEDFEHPRFVDFTIISPPLLTSEPKLGIILKNTVNVLHDFGLPEPCMHESEGKQRWGQDPLHAGSRDITCSRVHTIQVTCRSTTQVRCSRAHVSLCASVLSRSPGQKGCDTHFVVHAQFAVGQ